MPTSQQMADDALSIDRVERRLMRTLDDLYRDAKERAAPILEQLAQIEATRPRLPLILSTCPACARVLAPGWPCACAAPPAPPAPALIVTRDGVPVADQAAGVREFIDRATAPPYSRAEQARQAMLLAFADEPDATRRGFALAAIRNATDATCERVARLLK